MKVIVKESQVAGKGSFAIKGIRAREHILFFEGEVVSLAELNRRIAENGLNADDDIQIDENLFIDISKDSPTYFINHSCNPNAGIREQKELFALRTIEADEEITLDYSTTYDGETDKENIWRMQCGCNTENCRKEIGGIETIPQETLQKYIELGAVPDFMLRSYEYNLMYRDED